MRTKLLCFSFLFIALHANAQPSAKYREVDAFVEKFPFKAAALTDIRIMAREWKRQLQTDEEKARAVFYWVTHNIVYDCEGYRNGTGIHEPEEVMLKKKAICAGYASVFDFFCKELGLTSEVISGYATGIGTDSITTATISSNHAWNAVKIKGTWQLVDPTWGAGSANDDCTRQYREINEFYFLAKPDSFILSHLPESPEWQLLPKPLSDSEFIARIKKDKRDKGYTASADSIINKKVGELIRFQLPRNDGPFEIAITLLDEDHKDAGSVSGKMTPSPKGAFYDYKVKRAGKFWVFVYYTRITKAGDYETLPFDRFKLRVINAPARSAKPR